MVDDADEGFAFVEAPHGVQQFVVAFSVMLADVADAHAVATRHHLQGTFFGLALGITPFVLLLVSALATELTAISLAAFGFVSFAIALAAAGVLMRYEPAIAR